MLETIIYARNFGNAVTAVLSDEGQFCEHEDHQAHEHTRKECRAEHEHGGTREHDRVRFFPPFRDARYWDTAVVACFRRERTAGAHR